MNEATYVWADQSHVYLLHLIASSGLLSIAHSAKATPSACLIAGVRFVVKMTMWAMSDLRLRASGVLSMCDQFKMIWPHTVANPTEMIPLQTLGWLTHEKVVCPSHAAVEVELAVALAVEGIDPEVAAVGAARIDVRPEAFFWGTLRVSLMDNHKWIASPRPSSPMSVTPAPSLHRVAAALNGAGLAGNIWLIKPDFWRAMTPPAEVMHLAPAPCFHGATAVLNGASHG